MHKHAPLAHEVATLWHLGTSGLLQKLKFEPIFSVYTPLICSANPSGCKPE